MVMSDKSLKVVVVISLVCVNAAFVFLAIYLPLHAQSKNSDTMCDAAPAVRAALTRVGATGECGLCDAPYCTTASVRDNVAGGPIYQTADAIYQTADAIYQTADAIYQTADGLPACTNPGESVVAALCTSGAKWINHKECLLLTDTAGMQVRMTVELDDVQTSRLVTGTLHHAVLNKLDVCVIYYFSIFQGDTGTVVATGVCDTACNEAALEPATATPFSIRLSLPVSEGEAGTGVYALEITGAPAWDPSTILYTSPRTPLNLRPAENAAGVSATLNPVVAPAVAADMAKSYNYFVLPSQNAQLVVTRCPPTVCTADKGQSLFQKMVILAWQAVPVPPTLPSTPAMDNNNDPYDPNSATMKYSLERSGVPLLFDLFQQGGVSFYVVFDVAPVNTNVFYTLTAQLCDAEGSVLCESEPQYFSTNTQDFVASECAQFTRPVGEYPPNMWRDAWDASGMCIWDDNAMAAKDLVCLAKSLKTASGTGYSMDNMQLFDAPSEACQAIKTQFPSTSSAADFPFKELKITSPADPRCATGERGQAQVSCLKTVAMENTSTRLSFEDLSARLNNAVAFYDANPLLVNPGNDAKLEALLHQCSSNLETYWKTHYNVCGPLLSPTTWGVDRKNCFAGDDACLQYADTAACASNKCDGEWKVLADGDSVTTYVMEQTRFPAGGARGVCCHYNGTYSVGEDYAPSCACNEGSYGEWCENNPCNGIVCNGNGTCKLDDAIEPYCECKEHYHNVAKVSEDYYQLHGDECTYDGKTWTCTCPRMCGKDEQWSETNKCVKYEPLMCNQNKCVSTDYRKCDDELSSCYLCTSAARMTHEVSQNTMSCVAH
jgi:hypothetical protein